MRTHLSLAQWQPLRVLGSGTSKRSQAAVLRTTCRGRGWQEEAVAECQGSRHSASAGKAFEGVQPAVECGQV